MWKLLAISVLLFVKFGGNDGVPIDHVDVASNPQVDTITKEFKLSHPYSYSTAWGKSVYTTSKNATHLRITTPDGLHEHCNIAIDPVKDSLQGRFRTQLVVDGGVNFVVWGVQSKHDSASETRVNYTILVVDLRKCSYYRLLTPEEVLPRGWFDEDKHSPKMIVSTNRQDNLDVFYPSLTTCAPCRYWMHDGRKLELERQLQPEPVESTLFSAIELRTKIRAYYYITSFKNGTAVVKLISNEDYSVIRQTLLNHTVDAAAVSTDSKNSLLYLCYVAPPFLTGHLLDDASASPATSTDAHGNRFHCGIYDYLLKSGHTRELILPGNQQPNSFSLVVNRLREFLVSVQSTKPNGHEAFYFYNSLLGNEEPMLNYTLDFGEVGNSHSEKWTSRSFYGLDDNTDSVYCLEITRQFSNESDVLSHDRGVLKCIFDDVYRPED